MNYVEKIDYTIESIRDEVKAMTLSIHAHPELGLEEYHACTQQVELLKKHGFEIEENFCGIETAYRASYKSKKSGAKLAMLAEYDALPEIGHACGHNLIAAVAVAAGIAMRYFADETGGEICVIGTPAEETIGAKKMMAERGAFDDLDAAMMSHPMNFNSESLNTLAVKSVRFKYHGKTAHASGAPEHGINALDAVINLFCLINALRQQTQEDARIHGIIVKGGEAPNIIPDYAEAFFFVRAEKNDYLEELYEKVCSCAHAVALGTGCRLEIVPEDSDFCDTNSNMAITALNTKNMETLGVSMLRNTGKVMPGSSDMGNASYRCPGIQSIFDICNGVEAVAHTVEFAEAAATDYAINQAMLFAKGHAMTGYDILTDSEKLKAIRDEFAKISKRPAEQQ